MSVKTSTSGTCSGCEATFSKVQMSRHLERCAYPHAKEVVDVAQIRVDVPGTPYWLDLDVKTGATMRQLDEFLREIWLDCCGHLSSFDVGDVRYVVSMTEGGEPNEQTMKTRVAAALPPAGTIFTYEYDYGSTTELRMEFVAQRHAPGRREAVRLLARNDAPAWKCAKCGKTATSLCAECYPEKVSFLCKAHLKSHDCDSDAATLPVLNSPRMGVCAYVG